MTIVMDMSSCKIERDDGDEYGEEVLYAGWNPALDLACRPSACAASGAPMVMPPELATADMELFLRNMYACQR
jgi:hypothetical protein